MKLADWPSLRLVIPLAGGIIISDTIPDTGTVIHCVLFLSAPVLLLVLVSFCLGRKAPVLYGIGICTAFLAIGAWSYAEYSRKVHVPWPGSAATWQAHLTDFPQEKASSYRLDLEIDSPGYAGSNIILYVPKDSVVNCLEPGMGLAFHGLIEKPRNGDGVDFDYARYLYRHGVSGTLWVSTANWRAMPDLRYGGIRLAALRLRQRMMLKLGNWGLEGNVLAVVAAVSLGEKRCLDNSLRQVYSGSGASHVLAVSGLHVGIMFWLLGLLIPKGLFPMRRMWIRDIVVVGFMWAYAVAVGMPLSIVRSMTMFSMLSFCRAIGRDSQSVNTLSFAALAILTVEPEGLFDTGFQLSFLAVLAILLFEPGIHRLLSPRTAVGRYLWGIVSVSVAAQLGTAPIVAYNFGTMPTYFLLTNLVVIPAMFVVVSLSMLLWAVGWLPLLRGATVTVLTFLVSSENSILEHIVALPHSTLEFGAVGVGQVWTVYGMMLAVWLWLKEKRSSRLVHGLLLVAIVEVVRLAQNFAM